jgi:hypothetical protein
MTWDFDSFFCVQTECHGIYHDFPMDQWLTPPRIAGKSSISDDFPSSGSDFMDTSCRNGARVGKSFNNITVILPAMVNDTKA